MERITVFTPTYNRAKSLPRVFESLMHQTYNDFFWIIVDDGSTDNTKKLLTNLKTARLLELNIFIKKMPANIQRLTER